MTQSEQALAREVLARAAALQARTAELARVPAGDDAALQALVTTAQLLHDWATEVLTITQHLAATDRPAPDPGR